MGAGGKAWSGAELEWLAAACERHGVLIVSDEVHAAFYWGERSHRFIGELVPRSMTFTSHWTYTIDRDARIERREGSLPSTVKLPAVSVTVAPEASPQLTARLLRRLADELEGT